MTDQTDGIEMNNCHSHMSPSILKLIEKALNQVSPRRRQKLQTKLDKLRVIDVTEIELDLDLFLYGVKKLVDTSNTDRWVDEGKECELVMHIIFEYDSWYIVYSYSSGVCDYSDVSSVYNTFREFYAKTLEVYAKEDFSIKDYIQTDERLLMTVESLQKLQRLTPYGDQYVSNLFKTEREQERECECERGRINHQLNISEGSISHIETNPLRSGCPERTHVEISWMDSMGGESLSEKDFKQGDLSVVSHGEQIPLTDVPPELIRRLEAIDAQQ